MEENRVDTRLESIAAIVESAARAAAEVGIPEERHDCCVTIPDARWLVAEVRRLRAAMEGVIGTADEWVDEHCGKDPDPMFCENYGCESILELVLPLRSALNLPARSVGGVEGATPNE